MLDSILPAWVVPDPLKSRAVDALGLQVVADRLADRLLPGLSVLTTRARYFTFLCWARQKAGKRLNEPGIHRYEVALAITESCISEDSSDHQKDCTFVGKRNIETYRANYGNHVPRDARVVYKVPAWRAYRASMVAIGLLNENEDYGLTSQGVRAAELFQRAVRFRGSVPQSFTPKACLSDVSLPERTLLRDLLGISLRGTLTDGSSDPRTCRARFGREMRPFFNFDKGFLSPDAVFTARKYQKSGYLSEPANTIRAAMVWEYLCLGLNLLFVGWARAIEERQARAYRRELTMRLAGRRTTQNLAPVELTDVAAADAIAIAVGCLTEAVSRFDRLPTESSSLLDLSTFELARQITCRTQPSSHRARGALEQLLIRHQCAKGDEAWIECDNLSRLDLAKLNRDTKGSWQLPKRVPLHGYRMAAFAQIARDLGGL